MVAKLILNYFADMASNAKVPIRSNLKLRDGVSSISRFFILSILLLILVSFSGCIHVDLGNPFKEPTPTIEGYYVVHKNGFPLAHTFKVDEGDSIKYSETQPFYIYKGTEWINISIIVSLNSYNLVNSSPINLSFLERYVEVSLIDPSDEVVYKEKFLESDDKLVPVNSPASGRWIVAVEAKGFGVQGTYDSYMVDLITYEPV